MPLAAAAFFLLGRGFLGAFLIMSSRDWSMSMLAAVGWGVPSALDVLVGSSSRRSHRGTETSGLFRDEARTCRLGLSSLSPGTAEEGRDVVLPPRDPRPRRRRRYGGPAARRRASTPSAREARRARGDGDAGPERSPARKDPNKDSDGDGIAELAAPTRRSVGANLPPPPPPIAVKKTPPAEPRASTPTLAGAGGGRRHPRRARGEKQRDPPRTDATTNERRRATMTPGCDDAGTSRRATPGGTRRSFTGVRDLLEDLRAAIDDATLMEQQSSRWTPMDAPRSTRGAGRRRRPRARSSGPRWTPSKPIRTSTRTSSSPTEAWSSCC